MSPTNRKGTNLILDSASLTLAVKRTLAPFLLGGPTTDDLPPSTQTPSKEAFERASADARKRADELYKADEQLQAARRKHEAHYALEVTKLENAGKQVLNRFNKLEEEKVEAAASNGDDGVSDDDIIEINAGGKIMSARRGTLTQWKGTRLEALFSGRWDKMLLRDNEGRVFLDVDGDCFQAIVVYLNQLASSIEGNYHEPPTVYDELEAVLAHQQVLFQVPLPRMPRSNIVKQSSHASVIYNWLEEDGSDGEWDLIYSYSRDGLSDSNKAFHTNCDNKGPTIVLIETTEGGILGGYTNSSWQPSYYGYIKAKAEKAFIFTLTGCGLDFPLKMKLKDPNDVTAVEHNISCGPRFGRGPDLWVNDKTVGVRTGNSYELSPAQVEKNLSYTIKEMEVFSIKGTAPPFFQGLRKETKRPSYSPAIKKFTEEVNHGLNKKWESLYAFEAEVTQLEQLYKDEKHFIESLATGNTKDVVTLNVSGTMLATRRATLMVAEDSVLAQQFDDSKWTVQGSFPPVKAWTPDEVMNWVKEIEGIPDDVSGLFRENAINGSELLALNVEGLKMLGVKRVGTMCLLSDEISLLKKAANENKVTHIDHSPYCFGKILDYLRMKQLHSANLAKAPNPPSVKISQKRTFETVVDYYFPGDSSKFILG